MHSYLQEDTAVRGGEAACGGGVARPLLLERCVRLLAVLVERQAGLQGNSLQHRVAGREKHPAEPQPEGVPYLGHLISQRDGVRLRFLSHRQARRSTQIRR